MGTYQAAVGIRFQFPYESHTHSTEKPVEIITAFQQVYKAN